MLYKSVIYSVEIHTCLFVFLCASLCWNVEMAQCIPYFSIKVWRVYQIVILLHLQVCRVSRDISCVFQAVPTLFCRLCSSTCKALKTLLAVLHFTAFSRHSHFSLAVHSWVCSLFLWWNLLKHWCHLNCALSSTFVSLM